MVREFHDSALAMMKGEQGRAHCVVPVSAGVRGAWLPRRVGDVDRIRKHIAQSRGFGERSRG